MHSLTMPRGKSFRRSEAAKRRMAERRTEVVGPQSASSDPSACRGTGWCHKVHQWPTSAHTGRQHKLVIPAEVPGKKFVLVVGASHLRSLADGIVPMPEDRYSFGFMSTPGACADQLRTEVEHAALPRTPDAVCLTAPGNNLTASPTPEHGGAAFRRYLATVCSVWPTAQVFVVDLVPRLTVPGDVQEFFCQEFHRVSARLGVRYYHHAGRFPLNNRKLWCRDGVHLSDDMGMPLLVESLLAATTHHLEPPAPPPQVPRPVSPTPTPRPRPRVVPRVIVVGEVPVPRPPLPDWTSVESGRKRNHSGDHERGSGSPRKRVVHHVVDGAPVALQECFIPLNPVRFSHAMLAAMDKVVPSALGGVPTGNKTQPVERQRKPVSSTRGHGRKRVVATRKAVVSATVEKEAVEKKVVTSTPVLTVLPEACVLEQEEATPDPVSTCAASGPALPPGVATLPVAVPPAPVPVLPPGQRINPLPCRCFDNATHPVVLGNKVRTAASRVDVDGYVACSVVAAARHSVSPVCTWRASDIDDVCVEGWKLAAQVEKRGGFSQQEIGLYGRKWTVDVGQGMYKELRAFDDGTELREELQQHLLRDGMCVLNLHRAVNLIIQHGEYLVVVDCGERNASGLASDIGRSAVVFNTCWNDLMIHILNLKESLGAEWFGVSSISLEECVVEGESCSVPAPTRSQGRASVRGSFHQGDQRFKYGGLQCVAVTLVALVKHTTESVFSWQPDTLDQVVVSGDELYTSLREGNRISAGAERLCVPDLPRECVLEGQRFELEFGDFVAGDVDVVEGQFIDAGVHTTLSDGLSKMCTKYNTCFFTVGGNTCAIIGQRGKYAVVDSHARGADGMVDGAGQSVVLYLTSLQDLLEHFSTFAGSVKQTPKLFEISGVCVKRGGAGVEHCHGQVTAPVEESPVIPVVCAATTRGEKRKLPFRQYTSNREKSSEDVTVNSDIVFVGDVACKNLQFHPLSKDVGLALCRQLNIESERVDGAFLGLSVRLLVVRRSTIGKLD